MTNIRIHTNTYEYIRIHTSTRRTGLSDIRMFLSHKESTSYQPCKHFLYKQTSTRFIGGGGRFDRPPRVSFKCVCVCVCVEGGGGRGLHDTPSGFCKWGECESWMPPLSGFANFRKEIYSMLLIHC